MRSLAHSPNGTGWLSYAAELPEKSSEQPRTKLLLSTVALTWKFFRARPVKLRSSSLEADKTNVMLEYLELAFERLEME